jgi:hypothetical protein
VRVPSVNFFSGTAGFSITLLCVMPFTRKNFQTPDRRISGQVPTYSSSDQNSPHCPGSSASHPDSRTRIKDPVISHIVHDQHTHADPDRQSPRD